MDEIVRKMNKRRKLLYILSKCWLRWITIYYVAILIISLIVIISIISYLDNALSTNFLLSTLIASICVSNMLCSVQYLKLIYKACIENRIVFPSKGKEITQFGNILYFILRPIFAAVFVIITIVAILSGFIIITSSVNYIINNRFFYLCITISSFIGYSIGLVLDKFESLSIKKINCILMKKEDKYHV